ncbi:MAG: cation diffusion facilitator family transporter [Bacteroidia bacterium]|nr:cation diffusion facilitator family transporter [Bacteroidia bacterium]
MQKNFFHNCQHDTGGGHFQRDSEKTLSFERNTLYVVIISAVAMALEVFYGYHSGSVALLADGYHMGSHVFAIGLSWLAYWFARKWSNSAHISFNRDNLLALSGFTSGIILLLFCMEIIHESAERILHPENIIFSEAIGVACIGFVVNLLSIWFLHKDHDQHDLNIRSAYLHVLSDLMTSILAIVSLLIGYFFEIQRVDGFAGLISSIVIFYWSFGLIIKSCRFLLQFRKNG